VDPVFAQAALRHWAAAAQNPGPYRGAAGIFGSPGGLAASLIIGSAYLPDPAGSVHRSGAATTGMAHGIAGPLALLATAHAAGWSVAGQRAALQSAAHWLLRWRTEGAPSWAPYLTGEDLDRDTATPSAGRRDGWCYGAPGIGRALILAGSALADSQLTTAGHAAISSLADRPAHLWDVDGPTVCHGYAGVLQSATTSHAGTGERAAAAVADAFNPHLTFAFRHLHHGVPSDEPGLLTGSAGIALTLADHGQLPAPPVPTRWDSLLLLS